MPFEANGARGAAILKSTARSKCVHMRVPLSVHACICDVTHEWCCTCIGTFSVENFV